MKPLISIIIPVYNVEKYLNECIKSVVNQSYNNLDIIIINDGSTDNSENIMKEWAQKDKRIRIFTQENIGISKTRTKALKYVLGQYIAWVDSDDIIDSQMYEILVNNIIDADADISICVHKKFNEDKKILFDKSVNNHKSIYNNDIVQRLLKGEITGFLWDKLFKKELFDNIIFPEYSIGEDFYVNLNILSKSKKIVTSDFIGYYYRERRGSLLNSDNIEKKKSLLECDKAVIDFINTNNIDGIKWMNYRFISDNLLIHHQTKSIKSKEINELNKILKKNILSSIFNIPIFMNYSQIKNILYSIAFLIGLK